MVSQTIANSPEEVVTSLGKLPTDFNAWLDEEKALMEWVKRSVLTEEIEQADRQMDRALTAVKIEVRAKEYSSTASVAQAAHRIAVMLKNYGSVNKKPYEEQEGDVRTILLQLQTGGAYYADATATGIGTLVIELQEAFGTFQYQLSLRDKESLLKPVKTFPEVRRGIESVYHQIATVIDAGTVMNLLPGYAAFVDSLNPEIERLNEEFHRVQYDIAAAEPEPIPQQMYTGQPLTPTPAVYYVTQHDGTVKLELGKDYNLTYKNNTNVGNADCTIHGKGGYKGSKTVTFIIARTL
jgi:hypothetical protein